jgi:hypothetical protein
VIRANGLTLAQLKEDVREFLNSPNASIARIRQEILDPIKTFGRTYVIGGLVRDIAIYGLEQRPISDLDLVIRCSPRRLEDFAISRGGIKNRFGGFAIRTTAYRVDFWAFSRTWAKTAGHVKLRTPADLIKTTFFDWDAVVYGISEHKLWAIERYLHRLHSGILDVNLLDNPSRLGTLVRALRRLMMWDARPSPRLRSYVDHEIMNFQWFEILDAERHAFWTTYLSEFHSQDEFTHSVLGCSSFENRSLDRMRQAKFGLIERAPLAQEPPRVHRNVTVSTVPKKETKRRAIGHVADLFLK